ncbi:MAG: NAD(P)/FAD-dependent oxidoreductase [Galactobacter sp.]
MTQRPTSFETAERQGDVSAAREATASAKHSPFWLDDLGEITPKPPLTRDTSADLVVVGGGYNGLWTALRAKERDPNRSVLLLEAERVAWAASGRNGGFCEPSLTHGRSNASVHLAGHEEESSRLGETNLRELLETLRLYDIDCDVRPHGVIKLATEPHQEAALRSLAASDDSVELLEGAALTEQVRTEAASVGAWATEDGVILNPAKLARGLLRVCLDLGVAVHEHTCVTALKDTGGHMAVVTDGGTVLARRVALATNGFPSLLRRNRLHTVPVYDHAIVTEPLSPQQRASIGWKLEQGVTSMNSRFHYMRLLTDRDGKERLLLGGYDALYHYGRKVKPQYDTSESTSIKLALHLTHFFPQLEGIRFTHAWGGMIDTCSPFFCFFTKANRGKVVAANGFTGLGVAATRFAADTMLDLLDGEDTPRTRSKLVRSRPKPFPPEPFVWPAIHFTSAMMARSDRREGRPGLWLRLLNALKMGFDS